MGLLDDAIREHLELKRQRGADPGEVERLEREALGAPRQGEFAEAPAEEPAAAADEPATEFAEPETEVAAPADREPATEIAEPAEREPFDVEAVESADELPPQEPELPGPGAEAAAPGYDEDPWLDDERDEVPADETLDRPREAPAKPGEDVLEDTPDFLQETPEHERLWFEQRPPRDFDWDK